MEEAERWPALLVERLRAGGMSVADPRYIAQTAWTTDELLDAIAAERPRGPFDLVTLMVGVNDQYRARPVSAFAAGFTPVLAKAVALAGRRPSRTIVVSIPDWGATPYARGRNAERIAGDVDAYNARAADLVTAAGAAWVDVTTSSRRMAANPGLAVSDGLHPSGAMYREWAELIAPIVRAALVT